MIRLRISRGLPFVATVAAGPIMATALGPTNESGINFDFSAGILALQEDSEAATPDLADLQTDSPAELASTEDDLAKKTQNPVADLIGIPFQNNFTFPTGDNDGVMYVLNIQPVIPISISEH